jgi:8-oxo-dGTP pyrophosphatase MutT (NUDIX family)
LSRIPAIAAHFAASTPHHDDSSTRPRAAVAIVLAPDPDSVLLIRRAEREGDRWSGQLALPGGRWSPGDADLVATARRETAEEVGVDLSTRPVAAALDDLAPRTPALPPILVRPFLFTLPAAPALTPNGEVSAAWWVPLDRFQGPGVYGPVEYGRFGTTLRSVGYRLDIGVLWGMTERILTPLIDLLR